MSLAPQSRRAETRWSPALARLADAPAFQHGITAVILLAALLVGIETYPAAVERYGRWLHLLDRLVLSVFVAEVLIKLGACGRRPDAYFRDGWNVFDFLIVMACLLPIGGSSITVLRLLRLLRTLRLVHALPKLQVLVNALLGSIPSMAYVGLLLGLVFYVYGVAGVFFFGANDPVHFGSLGIAMLSLFRVVTLEDWTDIMYIQMYGCGGYGYGGIESRCTASEPQLALSIAFFVSFVLLGTMIMLNLFIGVIMTGMDEARKQQEALQAASREPPEVPAETVAALRASLASLSEAVRSLEQAAAAPRSAGGTQPSAGSESSTVPVT